VHEAENVEKHYRYRLVCVIGRLVQCPPPHEYQCLKNQKITRASMDIGTVKLAGVCDPPPHPPPLDSPELVYECLQLELWLNNEPGNVHAMCVRSPICLP
jgi:hypothetical protein